MSSLSFRSLAVLSVLVLSSLPSAFAKSHSEVVAYDDLQTKLVLQPGQTFLSFMQKRVKPGLDAFDGAVRGDKAFKSHRWSELQDSLISQGAGVAIRIDENNYIFNVGYNDGSDAQNDIKSGRSYGVGARGTMSDPSDIAYLKELESYLSSEPQAAGDFVEALVKVLVDCDSSGWAKLSEEGQSVATDFLAIYTAELDRHLMVNLNPRQHPWEIDLAAATFDSILNVETGLIMQNGKLVQASITSWWAQGATGSGIGNTRRDRLAFQQLIAKAEAGTSEAQAIASEIGAEPSSDLIQGVLVYLNSPEAPARMGRDRLPGLLADYLLDVRKNAKSILKTR